MVAVAGALAAIVLWIFAQPLLALIYGSELRATRLLRILLVAVPMDFVAALLAVCFSSRGFETFLLFACGSAALCNIVTNLVLIPRLGGDGAAVATLISYIYLDIVLFVGFLRKPLFTERGTIACANTC